MSPFDDPEICRSILESLPAGMCVLDIHKRITFWSAGAERITGHMRHEVIGHSCVPEPLLHCDQPGCEFCNEDCPIARAIKTSRPADATGILRHKAGHDVPVRIRAVPVRNERGSIIGALETFEELQQTADPAGREPLRQLPDCIDGTTGLASRAMMQSHVRQSLLTFSEVQIPFGLFLVRIEGLAHFRACLGPEAASALLRVVARTLESSLWITDFVGRWADDQFLLILTGCQQQGVQGIGSRLRRALAGESIEWWGERHSLPVSIGGTSAQSGDTVESMMERLQSALESSSAWRAGASGAGGMSCPGS